MFGEYVSGLGMGLSNSMDHLGMKILHCDPEV